MPYSQYKRMLARAIARAAFAPVIINNKNHKPMYSYTMGNFPKYQTEFIAFNINALWAALIFNDIRLSLDEGLNLKFNQPNTDWTGTPVKFMLCDSDRVRKMAPEPFDKYGSKVNFLQLVFPDAYGRYPEDPAYSHEDMDQTQPLLYSPKHEN